MARRGEGCERLRDEGNETADLLGTEIALWRLSVSPSFVHSP
jgi:hypothetical protein